MSMRKQLVQSISGLLARDERVVVLLGDIGVFGFRDAMRDFPARVYNVGILEQATVSMAAGLAKVGLIPIVHTIAPFLTERCLEQIKVDFGYQALGGNFITVGASYDYAALGCTHHCPGDVQVVSSIPGASVVLPGTAAEFDRLLSANYAAKGPNYFRLSEREHGADTGATGPAKVLRTGTKATVIAVGPMLAAVSKAVEGKDVTLLYYTTVTPFDAATLRDNCASGKVLLCEPYYRGGLSASITEALWPKPVLLKSVGVPREFLRGYGNVADHDAALGLDPAGIRAALETLLDV
jgi:transketolase